MSAANLRIRSRNPNGESWAESSMRQEDRVRARVICEGFIGKSLAYGRYIDDNLVSAAVDAAARGTAVRWNFSDFELPISNKQDESIDLNIDGLPAEVRSICSRHVTCNMQYRDGRKHRLSRMESWWNLGLLRADRWRVAAAVSDDLAAALEMLRKIPFASAREQQDLLKCKWIISPIALSQLFANMWETAFVSPSAAIVFPPGITIIDPGAPQFFDLDSVECKKCVLVEDGAPKTTIQDRESASLYETLPTGHASLDGPRLREYIVRATADGYTPQTLERDRNVIVISQINPVAQPPNTMFILRALSADSVHSMLSSQKIDAVNFFSQGTWHGPIQRGIGAWRSRWFCIPEPLSIFRVHHSCPLV